MRGELNERRSQVVLEAFEAMDKDKSGAVNASDLKVRIIPTYVHDSLVGISFCSTSNTPIEITRTLHNIPLVISIGFVCRCLASSRISNSGNHVGC